jgi:hypothetical protein
MYLRKQDEEVGAAFIARLGAATKIRLLQDLDRRIEDENTRREFREMVKRAAAINTERNRYIHSEYWSVPATEQLTVMLHRPLRDSNKPVNYPITIGELTKKIRQRRERGRDHGSRERHGTIGHELAAAVRASALTPPSPRSRQRPRACRRRPGGHAGRTRHLVAHAPQPNSACRKGDSSADCPRAAARHLADVG